MAEAAVRCPHCQSEAVVKYGKTSNGKERFRCQQTSQCGRTFLRSYAYRRETIKTSMVFLGVCAWCRLTLAVTKA